MKKLVPKLLLCLQILLFVHVQVVWSQEKTIEQADQTEISASPETETKKLELKTQLIELSGIIKLQQKILGDLNLNWIKIRLNSPRLLLKVKFPNQSEF